jgi:prephenate dehydrogenase
MRQVAIIGLGLMGGSLGLALRQRKAARVVGYARRAETRREALRLGAADAVAESVAAAVRDAELAVFCTPVLTIPALLRESLPAVRKGCVITDVGSTKAELAAELEPACRAAGAAFVGSHPMAGSEQTGLNAARPDLYDGAVVAVTPGADPAREAVAAVIDVWTRVGARVIAIDPQEHDRLVARTSHLPHLIAALLVAAAARDGHPNLREFCGPGFRDTTRVAGGSPEMWHDIVKSNLAAVLAELRGYDARLQELVRLLERGDFDAVQRLLETSRAARDGLVGGRNGAA